MNIDQLSSFLPNARHIDVWHSQLNRLLPINEITTLQRTCAFMAQCAHESMHFTKLKENLNYSDNGLLRVFPKYFPTAEIAKQFQYKPVEIANRVYSNRMGNGPEESGDGWKFRGRGLIQLTGKNNYTKCSQDISLDIVNNPDLLLSVGGAVKSALWFWKKNNLNQYADKEDIVGMTKVINGGTNGLQSRLDLYQQAINTFKVNK